MALELHITGPGLDTRRQLNPGDPELILGRDAGCGVHLPDPDRSVSRRHVAVWNHRDELHFRVLSQVNGIDMPQGYAPPGATGVVPPGMAMKVADYTVDVRAVAAQAAEQDPWSVFEQTGVGSDATLPRGSVTATASAPGFTEPAILPEEDPFGDWGFESTFGPGSPEESLKGLAQGPGAGDLASFYKGLGLDSPNMALLTPAELEAAGKAVRVALEGLFALYGARAGVARPENLEDGSVVPVKDNNPLKTHWPEQAKLEYVFGGRGASIGFLGPQRAMTGIVTELLSHEAAVAAATRAAVEGTLEEFAPTALKDRLLGVGTKLFEGARVWEAYTRYYGEKSQALSSWAQQLLDKYFDEAYLRETQRIKRETGLGS